MDSITIIPVSLLIESPTNPRKTFDEGDLQELADNIKANGILQPIVARPVTHSTGFEIVFGHRRFRAAQLADLAQVPVIVRAMTDEHVLIAQLSENMARADVHPIEEADAFERLIRDHGYTIDQLMEQTGKSRTAVYNRLKLASLAPEVRKECMALGIGAEIATLIARVPAPLQKQALDRVIYREYDTHVITVHSHRAARDALQRRFTTPLADAQFNPVDHYVNCDGPCLTCPKNTDNEPALQDLGAYVCTDTECFDERTQAFYKERLAAAGRLGVLLEGELDELRLTPRGMGNTVRWDRDAKRWLTWEDLLKRAREAGQECPQIYLYAGADGKPVECLKVADAEELAQRFAQADTVQQPTVGNEESQVEQAPVVQRTPAQLKLVDDWAAIKAAIFRRITKTQRSGEDLRLILLAQLELGGQLDAMAEAWLGWPEKIEALEDDGVHENDARLQMLDALTADEMAAALLIGAISDLADVNWAHVSEGILQRREKLAARYLVNVFEPDADLAGQEPDRDPRVPDMFEDQTDDATAEVAP